ncbi:hypothetical protein [Microcoleus sp. PH2017_05_CCC_O_A]|uniref:hypothetical protein n=1 Tax=Microcoleus sp. PH2017_05_CCC_O_A TaxID=2798816 RepID=UPI001D327DC2|nr:hypothetical protein [Microcoleus sp. PH2017_05_CCC_O_A]MCC3436920.1 hypothetical protein [Microcoleus sp. PH2017_05_CCC_O_A]
MKQFKSWRSLLLAALTFISISLFAFLAHPSDATSTVNRMMIDTSLISVVRTPQELEEMGFGYLQRIQPQLTASLIDNIKTAERTVAQLPERPAMRIPVAGRGPIRSGVLQGDNGGPRVPPERYNYVGSRNPSSARAENITPPSLRGMFAQEARNDGTLNGQNLSRAIQESKTLVADARGYFLQAQSISTFDMYVEDTETKQIELWPDIAADAVCRDALNAVLTNSWTEY